MKTQSSFIIALNPLCYNRTTSKEQKDTFISLAQRVAVLVCVYLKSEWKFCEQLQQSLKTVFLIAFFAVSICDETTTIQ